MDTRYGALRQHYPVIDIFLYWCRYLHHPPPPFSLLVRGRNSLKQRLPSLGRRSCEEPCPDWGIDIESAPASSENTYLINAFDLASNSLLSIHKYQNVSFSCHHKHKHILHRRLPDRDTIIDQHSHSNFETYNSSYPLIMVFRSIDPPLFMPHISSLQHSIDDHRGPHHHHNECLPPFLSMCSHHSVSSFKHCGVDHITLFSSLHRAPSILLQHDRVCGARSRTDPQCNDLQGALWKVSWFSCAVERRWENGERLCKE